MYLQYFDTVGWVFWPVKTVSLSHNNLYCVVGDVKHCWIQFNLIQSYANSVLFGCPQKHADRLQRVQQALARVVTQQSSVSPLTSTELLKQLHWLPIGWRIRFKLACLVHKILILVTRHTLMSSYNITSPQGPRVHLPVTYFLFRSITFHLVLALSASLRPKYGTPYLFTSANPKHTLPPDVS